MRAEYQAQTETILYHVNEIKLIFTTQKMFFTAKMMNYQCFSVNRDFLLNWCDLAAIDDDRAGARAGREGEGPDGRCEICPGNEGVRSPLGGRGWRLR